MQSGIYCGSYKIISVTAKRLLESQIFEKKMAVFPLKRLFRPIFFVVSNITSIREQFIKVQNGF